MRRLWRRYRWWVLFCLLVYAAISGWLFLATRSSEEAPFEYQVF
jgi:hypothetical protein